MLEWPALMGTVLAFAVAYLLVLYAVQLRTRDAGIVDFGWASGLGIAALFLAIAAQGDPYARVAMAAVAVPWSARLAYYIFSDRLGHEEDARYAMLREGWGDAAPQRFLGVFLMNALLVAGFGLCYMAVALQPGTPPTPLLAAGVLVGWGAILGESVADRQLQHWRRQPENKGKTCRAGLWRYSRHPNYFFEWTHWFAYVILAVGSPWWPVTLLGPAVMLFFLYRFTGIPFAERQAIKSRGDDYRAYQRTTSPFLPWFPREDRA